MERPRSRSRSSSPHRSFGRRGRGRVFRPFRGRGMYRGRGQDTYRGRGRGGRGRGGFWDRNNRSPSKSPDYFKYSPERRPRSRSRGRSKSRPRSKSCGRRSRSRSRSRGRSPGPRGRSPTRRMSRGPPGRSRSRHRPPSQSRRGPRSRSRSYSPRRRSPSAERHRRSPYRSKSRPKSRARTPQYRSKSKSPFKYRSRSHSRERFKSRSRSNSRGRGNSPNPISNERFSRRSWSTDRTFIASSGTKPVQQRYRSMSKSPRSLSKGYQSNDDNEDVILVSSNIKATDKMYASFDTLGQASKQGRSDEMGGRNPLSTRIGKLINDLPVPDHADKPSVRSNSPHFNQGDLSKLTRVVHRNVHSLDAESKTDRFESSVFPGSSGGDVLPGLGESDIQREKDVKSLIPGLDQDIEDEDEFLYGDTENSPKKPAPASKKPEAIGSSEIEWESDREPAGFSAIANEVIAAKSSHDKSNRADNFLETGMNPPRPAHSRNSEDDLGYRSQLSDKYRQRQYSPDHGGQERRRDETYIAERPRSDHISEPNRHHQFEPMAERNPQPTYTDLQRNTDALKSQGEPPKSTDKTLENILKSIGFDFQMSNLIQEKAKKEREKSVEENIAEYGIKERSSFLEGGLHNIDRGSLFDSKPPESNNPLKGKLGALAPRVETYEERAKRYLEEQKIAESSQMQHSQEQIYSRKPGYELNTRHPPNEYREIPLQPVLDDPYERNKHLQDYRHGQNEYSSHHGSEFQHRDYHDDYESRLYREMHAAESKVHSNINQQTSNIQDIPHRQKYNEHSTYYRSPNSDKLPKHSDDVRRVLPREESLRSQYSEVESHRIDERYRSDHRMEEPRRNEDDVYRREDRDIYRRDERYRTDERKEEYRRNEDRDIYSRDERYRADPRRDEERRNEELRMKVEREPGPTHRYSRDEDKDDIERSYRREYSDEARSFKEFSERKHRRDSEENRTVNLTPTPRSSDRTPQDERSVSHDRREQAYRDTGNIKITTSLEKSDRTEERRIIVVKERPEEETPEKPVTKSKMSKEEREKLLREMEERKKRLKALERELEHLRKQQNEVMRKRQREKDGHKDPVLIENSQLQEEIAKQIAALRKTAQINARRLKDDSTSDSEDEVTRKRPRKDERTEKTKEEFERKRKRDSLEAEEEAKNKRVSQIKEEKEEKKPSIEEFRKSLLIRFEYYDPGNHWCKHCNHVSGNVYEVFEHLHSKRHTGKMDPFNRPWLPESLKNPTAKPDKTKGAVAPFKGVEFLMAAKAFYCSLCKVFAGDGTCAEDHLKSEEHNEQYRNYCDDNPYHEKRLNLDKAAGLSIKRDLARKAGQAKEEEKQKKRREEEIKSREKKKKLDKYVEKKRKESEQKEKEEKKRSSQKKRRSSTSSTSSSSESNTSSSEASDSDTKSSQKRHDSGEKYRGKPTQKFYTAPKNVTKTVTNMLDSISGDSKKVTTSKITRAETSDKQTKETENRKGEDSSKSTEAAKTDAKSSWRWKMTGPAPGMKKTFGRGKTINMKLGTIKSIADSIPEQKQPIAPPEVIVHERPARQTSKSDTGLSDFLKIGSGDNSKFKPLPIVKEIPLPEMRIKYMRKKAVDREVEEDMKLLGLDKDDSTVSNIKVKPPMIVQQKSSQGATQSMSSSDVGKIYDVFFGDQSKKTEKPGGFNSNGNRKDKGANSGNRESNDVDPGYIDIFDEYEVLDEVS